MQNNKQHTEFIRRLKQQPRHSSTPWETFSQAVIGTVNTLQDAATDIKNTLEIMFDDIRTQMDASITGFQTANNQYLTGLEKRLAMDRLVIKNIEKLGERSLYFEKRNQTLNKTLGVSSIKAAELSQHLAIGAQKFGLSSKLALQYVDSLNTIVPSLNIIDNASGTAFGSLQAVQSSLVTNLGLTKETAQEFSYYATQQGADAVLQLNATKGIAEVMDEALGTQNSFKIVTEEIGGSTASTQLQFGRMGASLELAAIKGRNLGLKLDQVAGIGNKMLNIESSIGDELEYQLLSGRRLIGDKRANVALQGKSLTNAFREAALMGDANKQADALNAILTQEGETLSNNVIARQQMAKLLGMEESQLARALQKKKLLEQMGADEKLFQLTGDAFVNQLKDLKAEGKATDLQVQQAMKLADTRTTDELMKHQVDLSEDIKIATFLQTQQQKEIAENQFELIRKVISAQSALEDPDRFKRAEIKKIGGAQLGYQQYGLVANIISEIKGAKMETDNANDFLAINGKLVKYRKDDLVIGGTFGGRRQEVINQVTQNASGGNGGGGGMNAEQFAQAIVSAMKSAKFSVAVDDVAAMFVNT